MIEPHNPDKPAVVLYGAPRCGTVFVWQFLNHIFPNKVLKLHEGEPPAGVPVILVYRDFRDAFLSFCKTYGDGSISRVELLTKIQLYKRFLYDSVRLAYSPSVQVFLKYEDIIDLTRLRRELEARYHLEIDDNKFHEIERLYSKDSNQRIADRMAKEGKTFHDGQDPQTLIHAGHITNSNWRQDLDTANRHLLNSLLYTELKIFSYEPE